LIDRIISFSIRHKLIILLFTAGLAGWGVYSVRSLSIGSVPDITSNQVQIYTVARNLATEEVEKFITYPVELAVANLPGVQEIRSVSKFGLSFVTVVFDEEMGNYLPRQLIAEKLKSAQELIPEGYGSPEMAPITTGLGEIYQYTLETRPGYDPAYTAMDLREIQDWIIRRQLAGTPGVVEINSWGGFLKQYEVALNPEKLLNMKVSLLEVYDALRQNNQNTGGAYIEKNATSFFIRGEGRINTLKDIEEIVVRRHETAPGSQVIPLRIGDVADVQIGYATRFGAITGNGEGEKVLGQVMMLKGANPYAVITEVKARLAEIEKTLPEGIVINGFLDRSNLIQKTTNTVLENLILGALFVIFVLVLLIGNFRSGLIVASVIPLSMLFGITLMTIFDVDANLLSLGAIDFGIIIDGAVIIVEFAVYKLSQNTSRLQQLNGESRTVERDKLVEASSSRMMRSAIFGQVIILIVFIPILSLEGVEGRMFRPLALTFMFVLLGAMLHCLTYVPAITALLLRSGSKGHISFSDKIIHAVQHFYNPIIRWGLDHRIMVVSLSLVALVATAFVFSRLGGEFIPTLDEGDYVIQPVLKPGTSLSQTTEVTTRIEAILLEKFPDEVAQVITRIGAAEVPTDPMSMEMSDVIVKLKPVREWSRAKSKEALAEEMTEELNALPGITYEFTQPIEMRFNELLTGVRSDIAIKIFGENLQTLYRLGNRSSELISDVEGIASVSVEQIVGLPQIRVAFDRQKIASYHMNVNEVSRIINMAFSGSTAGTVYEGERRFDLAVRLNRDNVDNVDDVRQLPVELPAGGQVPLSQLANISVESGPAQISRDDTRRRIVVNINARDRDIESLVNEIREILDEQLALPVGYSITYGGQFENLRQARQRLTTVVPVALVLIFILLNLTLGSLREALLVFVAIPLAAIGGVTALYLRDMLFSVPAGIGFIALFGIAVLNGIVLIQYFKDLKKEGVTDVRERILQGTKTRLRPVLMTATTDILGFLPMAVSTSPGAEVQRPLATVVIGGLITAFFLTLLVLPVLYSLTERTPDLLKVKNLHPKKVFGALVLLSGFILPLQSVAQQEVGLDEAITIAVENNAGIAAEQYSLSAYGQQQKAAFDLPRTLLFIQTEENAYALENDGIHSLGIQQNIHFPTYYMARGAVGRERQNIAAWTVETQKLQLAREVSMAWYEWQYHRSRLSLYTYLDTLYNQLYRAARRRLETGQTNRLEEVNARAQLQKTSARMLQIQQELEAVSRRFAALLQSEDSLLIRPDSLQRVPLQDEMSNPRFQYYMANAGYYRQQWRLQQTRFLPDFQLQYFAQRVNGETGFFGYQLGLNLPLWFPSRIRKAQAAQLQYEAAQARAENFSQRWQGRRQELRQLLSKHEAYLSYYEEDGLELVEEIIAVANQSYRTGESDYVAYLQSLEQATQLRLDYLQSLFNYNQAALELNYLTSSGIE
jgi:heavy metal efflux system protein